MRKVVSVSYAVRVCVRVCVVCPCLCVYAYLLCYPCAQLSKAKCPTLDSTRYFCRSSAVAPVTPSGTFHLHSPIRNWEISQLARRQHEQQQQLELKIFPDHVLPRIRIVVVADFAACLCFCPSRAFAFVFIHNLSMFLLLLLLFSCWFFVPSSIHL